MMKVLVIGNSFGTDGTHYLYGVARADGQEMKAVNLYIGGCSLYRHYRNMLSEEPAYSFEINGHISGLFVSLKNALLSDEWDAVLMHQCSPDSADESSYEPYASALAAYVRKHAPKAKLYVHQTWTFDTGAERFKLTKFSTPETMFPAIKEAYRKMAENVAADGLIPSGEAMYRLWQKRAEFGIERVHRDGFHADFGVGRYLLALVIYRTLTGRDVRHNSFADFDVSVSEQAAEGARVIASQVCDEYENLR